MPCDCSHLEANKLEIEISKVRCGLDELEGRKVSAHWWKGYHPKVYSKWVQRNEADALTEKLCAKMQALQKANKLTTVSLELQMWWRDHKATDARKNQ